MRSFGHNKAFVDFHIVELVSTNHVGRALTYVFVWVDNVLNSNLLENPSMRF